MSALKWIYDNRVDSYGLRVRRFGSRKFGLVANVMTGDPYPARSRNASASSSPSLTSSDADIRGHIWSLPGGRGLGLGWGPR